MRIGIIGNSHAAGLKRAWDALAPDDPGVALVFFVAPAKRILGLTRQGDRLVPGNDDLRARLRLSSGGQGEVVLAEYHAILIYGMVGLPQFDRRLSQQLHEIILNRAAKRIATHPMLRLLHHGPPLFIGPAPVPVPETPGSAVQHLPHATLLAEIRCRLPPNAPHLLPQPAQTLSDGVTTDAAFLHGPGDFGHMNLDYNCRYLRQHLPALTG